MFSLYLRSVGSLNFGFFAARGKVYALLGNDNERSYLFLVLYINKWLRVVNQIKMSAGTRRRLEDALNAGKEIENNR